MQGKKNSTPGIVSERAAALELLEALQGIEREYDSTSHEDMFAVASEMVRIARAALAKAEA